jgi:hypothetical protein
MDILCPWGCENTRWLLFMVSSLHTNVRAFYHNISCLSAWASIYANKVHAYVCGRISINTWGQRSSTGKMHWSPKPTTAEELYLNPHLAPY